MHIFAVNKTTPNNMKKYLKGHQKFYRHLILNAGHSRIPWSAAYECIKEMWLFINSDEAAINGTTIDNISRSTVVNPINGRFDMFFDAEIEYSATRNNIELIEQSFIDEIRMWLRSQSVNEPVEVKRKFREFDNYIVVNFDH